MKSLFAILTTCTAMLIATSAAAQNQAIDQFHQNEYTAIQWNQRYQSAPGGSWEESQARNERDRAIQYALGAINQPYAFYGLNRQQVEYFADEMTQKYNQAPGGSALESMYRQAQGYAFQAFRTAVMEEVRQLSNDWRRLQSLAQYFDQQYQAAPGGSQKEAAYNDGRRQAWNTLPQAVNAETYYYQDFRQHEQMANHFDGLYQAAPGGSLSETAYRQISRDNYNQGVQKAQSQFQYLSQNDLYNIQARYDQQYQAAPGGSVKESYYRQIRDLARNMIGYHP